MSAFDTLPDAIVRLLAQIPADASAHGLAHDAVG